VEFFTYDGFEYPNDSIYAKVMAKYQWPPEFSSYSKELWEEKKLWALEKGITPEELDEHLYERQFGAQRVARAYLEGREPTQQPNPKPHSERPFR
tara:strand:+ start:281 stop:565 length:285 start_codon:yes stop_codon:yes gene_type:complete